MDINTVRTLLTVLSFAMFVAIVWWAYSAKNEDRFKEAANLPFADEDLASEPASNVSGKGQQQ